MGIIPIDRVLTTNNSFDPKWPETQFLSQSTWLDPYWPGELGFDRKWRFRPETARNSFFFLVDMVWPVLTRWTRFWPETAWNSFFTLIDMVWPVLTQRTWFWLKMMVLTWNDLKTHFLLGQHGLTCIDRWNRFLWKDAVDSRKIYFW